MPTKGTGNRSVDVFPNIIVEDIFTSAANTLTFQEINVGLNIFDKVGIRIQRIEYLMRTSVIAEMTTTGDYLEGAITSADGLTDISLVRPDVIDYFGLLRHDMGAAASGQLAVLPVVHDFSTMGGGGILVPPKPLFVAWNTVGLASVANLKVRIFFTLIRLTDVQYLELLETRRAFG